MTEKSFIIKSFYKRACRFVLGSNDREIERDDLSSDISSIGALTRAGMTEERSERRIKARRNSRLLFSASWKDTKGEEEEEDSLRWLPPRECLDPELNAAESLRDEEEKCEGTDASECNPGRVTLSVDFLWCSQNSRGSPLPFEKKKHKETQ